MALIQEEEAAPREAEYGENGEEAAGGSGPAWELGLPKDPFPGSFDFGAYPPESIA